MTCGILGPTITSSGFTLSYLQPIECPRTRRTRRSRKARAVFFEDAAVLHWTACPSIANLGGSAKLARASRGAPRNGPAAGGLRNRGAAVTIAHHRRGSAPTGRAAGRQQAVRSGTHSVGA